MSLPGLSPFAARLGKQWTRGAAPGMVRPMIVPAEGDFRLDDVTATARLGAALARVLRPGEALCLSGPLGAGKSVLARGAIRALTTPDEEAPSPTFTLAQFYKGEGLDLTHFDLYRLANAEEAFEVGLDEALEEGAVIIEWPERLDPHRPADRLDIEIAIDETGEARHARLTPHGAWEGRGIEFGA